MTRAVLSLGSNLGDRLADLRLAVAGLGEAVRAISPVYETAPWGIADQPDFLNAAAELSTRLSPRALLDLCLDAERKLKRVREERWGPRLIDIDILVFGDRIIHETGLEVPHPRMLERAFVLAPLAEIAPDLAVGGRSVSVRLAAVDASGIERLPSGRDWWLT